MIDASQFPLRIAIETTSHCNAQCFFCPLHGKNAEMTREKGVMGDKLFRKIISEIDANYESVETVYLNICGEPLLDPYFISRLDSIKRTNVGQLIDLQTNGHYLEAEIIASILNSNIKVVTVGFDGIDASIYENHRKNCSYNKVLSNIKLFLSERNKRQSGTALAVKYVVTTENQSQIDKAKAIWRETLLTDIDSFEVCNSENWATERLDKDHRIIKTTQNYDGEMQPCRFPFYFLNILHDGEIAVCCWDYNLDIFGKIGNVGQKSIAENWNGEGFQKLRRRIMKHDKSHPRCSICSGRFS